MYELSAVAEISKCVGFNLVLARVWRELSAAYEQFPPSVLEAYILSRSSKEVHVKRKDTVFLFRNGTEASTG